MSRTTSALLAVAAVCLTASPAGHANPPGYFFKEWTISKDCSEQHAGPSGHVQTGLKFRIRPAKSAGGWRLEAIDADQLYWAGGWRSLKLEYRPGVKMGKLPADFECVPGAAASSPFLAMTNYSQTAEPWYEYEHWYALLAVHGEPHHVLIFPRDVEGTSSAIILIQDADASDSIKLDHNGVIHSED